MALCAGQAPRTGALELTIKNKRVWGPGRAPEKVPPEIIKKVGTRCLQSTVRNLKENWRTTQNGPLSFFIAVP